MGRVWPIGVVIGFDSAWDGFWELVTDGAGEVQAVRLKLRLKRKLVIMAVTTAGFTGLDLEELDLEELDLKELDLGVWHFNISDFP